MGRSASQPVHTPGAVAAEASTADQADGASAATSDVAAVDTQDRTAELEATVRAQAEEIDRLRAAAGAGAPKLPQVVYEPETPHGKEKLAASATAGMTVAQVQQAIDDKRLPEPVTSYLCADGYYARRG